MSRAADSARRPSLVAVPEQPACFGDFPAVDEAAKLIRYVGFPTDTAAELADAGFTVLGFVVLP